MKEGGFLRLDINYPRELLMEEGEHQLDVLIEDLKIRYSTHKKWEEYLAKRKLLNCKFAYKTMVIPGSNKLFFADKIKALHKKSTNSVDDARVINITWENPEKRYKGNYHILIQESFGYKLLTDILTTEENQIAIPIQGFERSLKQYTILAEDCRSSHPVKLKL